MIHLLQKAKNPTGLALGWNIEPGRDQAIRAALPGWAIVVWDSAPLIVTLADLAQARKLAGVSAAVPVGLFAWGDGVQSVGCILTRNLVQPWAVHLADDSTAARLPWKVKAWSDLVQDARAGKVRFTATCTTWPAAWALGQALGLGDQGVQVGAPVAEGLLYVERFQAPEDPKTADGALAAWAAHLDQVTVQLPRTLAKYWKGEIEQ